MHNQPLMSLKRRLRFIWRYMHGRTPWDSGQVPPEIIDWLARHDGSPGRALDLGCGPGTTAIHLARHGWHTVGVDFAPNAIARARKRARREARNGAFAGSLRFLSADVARPALLADEAPFDLLIDVGCMHGLPRAKLPSYAANLVHWARPGAAFLLYAFLPFTNDAGRDIGISRADLRALLNPAFEIVAYAEGEEVTTPRPSAWYTLRRTESAP